MEDAVAVRKKVQVLKKETRQVGTKTMIVLVKGTVLREREAMVVYPPRVEHVSVHVAGDAFAEIPVHMRRVFGGRRYHESGTP